MKALMDRDSVANLKLADEYMSLGNVVKNFGGMNESVKKTGLMGIKANEEKAFMDFAKRSEKTEYLHIVGRIDSLVTAVEDTLHDYYLLNYTFGAMKFNIRTSLVDNYIKVLEADSTEALSTAADALREAQKMVAGVDLDFDRATVELLIPYWVKYNRLGLNPLVSDGNYKTLIENIYTQSIFRSAETLEAFLAAPSADVLKNDPLYTYWKQYSQFSKNNFGDALNHYNVKRAELDKIYTRGLCEMYNWSKAPDANFTLRMTYGHVMGYSPRDAVKYDWNTVLDGMLEKENPKDPDYVMNEDLRKFYLSGNYAGYARKDGKLPTCFLSNNDITGGNSGSPVMNAKGELIGIAFDGNIESLSSDLRFNPELQRCINVDIRYVLFLIDTFGGSSYVLDEMEIRK